MACEKDLVASFQQLEASSSFGVAFVSLYDLLGDDHVVASLLYLLVAYVLGMVFSLPLQLRLVACVLVVALLPWEELYHQWKMSPIEGVVLIANECVDSFLSPSVGVFLSCFVQVILPLPFSGLSKSL